MTENVNVSESASQNQNSQNVSPQNNSAPVSQPNSEKLLRQSEVNELVGRIKNETREQAKQEVLAELQKQQPITPVSAPTTINNTSTQAASAPVLTQEQKEALKKEIVGDFQTQQLVHQFAIKMSNGTKKYPDFEQVVSPLQLQNIPDVVRLANGFENTEDIMYDLGRNPSKVSSLMILAQINPQLAYTEMQTLSNSIKKNEEAAANQKNIREPLSQIKSSNVGVDNGSRTVSDIRRDPRYRV